VHITLLFLHSLKKNDAYFRPLASTASSARSNFFKKGREKSNPTKKGTNELCVIANDYTQQQ